VVLVGRLTFIEFDASHPRARWSEGHPVSFRFQGKKEVIGRTECRIQLVLGSHNINEKTLEWTKQASLILSRLQEMRLDANEQLVSLIRWLGQFAGGTRFNAAARDPWKW